MRVHAHTHTYTCQLFLLPVKVTWYPEVCKHPLAHWHAAVWPFNLYSTVQYWHTFVVFYLVGYRQYLVQFQSHHPWSSACDGKLISNDWVESLPLTYLPSSSCPGRAPPHIQMLPLSQPSTDFRKLCECSTLWSQIPWPTLEPATQTALVRTSLTHGNLW